MSYKNDTQQQQNNIIYNNQSAKLDGGITF